jgi:hypothetical protein
MNDSQKMEKLEEMKYYFFNEQQYSIGRHNLHGIEWLRNFLLDTNFNRNFVKSDTLLIYLEIMNNLKNITVKYYQIRDDIYMKVDTELLFHPENFFNEIILNRHKENYWFGKYKEGTELLDAFEYMLYVIINYLDDLEFDVNYIEVHQEYNNKTHYVDIEEVNENPLLGISDTNSLILQCD